MSWASTRVVVSTHNSLQVLDLGLSQGWAEMDSNRGRQGKQAALD